ncbi:hypothetical protein [Chryseobacterium oryzae]|uniref:Histidine Kinase domain-containing protein n=1 Tax=Chryseobacterium oryzae TaxID=2929799 RepID=A0ABY4BKK9_9FLAO|nr:hypothetical protein [Chryseobacterium oryzae]UOE39709.1 hypothetical protein MTP08_14550 [Chryseobacterium oryzae]
MAKDKYDFIQELLENKKLKPAQRERVLMLAKEEIKKDGVFGKDLEERVKKLEMSIEGKTTIDNKNKQAETFINKHDPKSMVSFLNGFSKNDDLKWFTHKPDPNQEFNYPDYILYAKELLPKNAKVNINFLTYSNIRNFLFLTEDNNGNRYPCWKNYNENINYTWCDIKDWCEIHPNIHPYTAEINGESFEIFINQFKNVIEFRTDVSDFNFFNRIKELIKTRLSKDVKPKYLDGFRNIGQTLNTYIDTNLFFHAIIQIIEWININKAKSNEVSFDLVDRDGFYQFEIFHKNSYMSYAPDSLKIMGQQGDFDKTKKNLFCVADWEIETELDNKKNYRITCLDDNTVVEIKNKQNVISKNIISELDYKIGGLKHILKLYKTI